MYVNATIGYIRVCYFYDSIYVTAISLLVLASILKFVVFINHFNSPAELVTLRFVINLFYWYAVFFAPVERMKENSEKF